MEGQIKKLGKHTLIYGAGLVASKLAGFIMLPIYTRMLTPSDYGVLELLTTTVDLIGTITSLGLLAGVFKFHSEQETERRKDLVISTSGILLTGLALVTGVAGFLAAPILSRVVLGDAGRPLYFQIFFVMYFFQTATDVPLLYLRAQEKSVLFVSASVGKLLLMLGLNIWFVVVLRMGVLGVLLGNLIANALLAAALLYYTIDSVGVGFSRDLGRSLAAFGAPMMVWSLGNFVLVFSDRYFLQYYASTAAVGIYSLAYRFASVLTALGFRPFFLMWSQQRFEVANREDAQEVFPRVFFYMNLCLGLVALLIVLFVDEVVTVMADPSFHPAYRVVPLLIAAQIIYHWVPFSNLGLFIHDESQMMGKIALVAAGIMVVLNFALVPRYGVFGATWATLITYAIRYGLILAASQREYEIDHDWGRIVRLYGVFGLAFLLEQLFGGGGLVISSLVSGAAALAGAGLIYYWLLTDHERGVTVKGISRGVSFLAQLPRRWAAAD